MTQNPPYSCLFYASQHPTYRIVVACFIAGSLAHLWLADAAQESWLLSNVIFLVGLLFLARRGSAIGWIFCAAAKAISLLFLRDHLTQSMVLLFLASAGALFMLLEGCQKQKDTQQSQPLNYPTTPFIRAFLNVCRAITVLVYALAGLHKLNRDFIAPELSCATYGFTKLTDYWNLPADILPETWLPSLAIFVIATELGIAVLYLCGLRRPAWLLAIAFHIPLTLTMAPAYAFVMLAGHAAFLRPKDLQDIRAVFQQFSVWIASKAIVLTAISLYLHGAWPEWSMIPKEALLWALLLTCTLLIARHGLAKTPPIFTTFSTHFFANRPGQIALLFSVLFALNGLLPYVGLRFSHTGAMVSNLRIDRGCWNSLVFPESMRITDDYIRIEKTHLARPGFLLEYETILLEKLWSPPQLLQMRRNWCKPVLRPIFLEGTFRERAFVIEDLCDEQPLPFADDGMLGIEIFKNSLRFQKNLLKQCPTTCIH